MNRPDDFFLPAAIRARYHYRGDQRRRADERRAVIRRLTEAVLSESKLARVVAASDEEWIEEVGRAVRRRVRQVLKGDNKDGQDRRK